MIKIVVPIRIEEKYPKGYGMMYPPTEYEVMEKIYEELNNKYLKYKYIKHFVTDRWIENPTLPTYDVVVDDYIENKIPMGTLYINAEVYLEEK